MTNKLAEEQDVYVTDANEYKIVPRDKPIVCVFCGASAGTSSKHLEAARSLAQAFHENEITLIYGGGTSGIMGEIARTLVSLSGPQSVIGIIPTPLIRYEQSGKSPAISEYGQTIRVNSMHTRKHLMAQHVLAGGKGSGFVALSGGYGTLEELMEVTTWNQLGIHEQGVVVYNIDGYWDGLLQWVNGAVKAGFISESNGGIMVEATTADDVVKELKDYIGSKDRFNLQWNDEK